MSLRLGQTRPVNGLSGRCVPVLMRLHLGGGGAITGVVRSELSCCSGVGCLRCINSAKCTSFFLSHTCSIILARKWLSVHASSIHGLHSGPVAS